MMVVLSTFVISLEYSDSQCVKISFQCCNLLATPMFITRKKVCRSKFQLFSRCLVKELMKRETLGLKRISVKLRSTWALGNKFERSGTIVCCGYELGPE